MTKMSWRRRLDIKLIGVTLLFLALVTLFSSLHTLSGEQRVLLEQIDAQGESLANAASIFAIEPMLIRDYPVMETYVEQLAQDRYDIGFVRIQRADNRVVAEAPENSPSSHVRTYTAPIQVSLEEFSEETPILGTVTVGMLTRRSDRMIVSRLWGLGITSISTFLILSILLFFLIRKTVANPLRSLDRQAASLGDGDLDQSISLPSHDELGRLAETLETMRGNLKNSYAEIQTQNEELKELDRMKDDFLANVTHELKTPLNGVLGLGTAMRDGAYGGIPSFLVAPLDRILQSANNLLRLTEQLLTFSKRPDDDKALEKKELQLKPYLENILEDFSIEIQKKGLTSECLVEENLTLWTDVDVLDRIVINLIGNAVKFTHTGYVRVQARSTEKTVILSVEDSGIGIPLELQKKVFDRFQQGFASESRSYGGFGIGLSLVRQNTQCLGGEVRLKSAEERGSLFSVLLPRSETISEEMVQQEFSESPAWTDEALPERPLSESEKRDVHGDRTCGEFPTPPTMKVEKRDFHGKNTGGSGVQASVLVVDDDEINREVVSVHLRREFNVFEAENGGACLERLQSDVVDILLLDLMMPGMSGFDVLEKLKHDSVGVPVIVLSAKNQALPIQRAFEQGAVDYVTKPFHREELLSRIRTHINLAHARDQALMAEQLIRKQQEELEETVVQRTRALTESNVYLNAIMNTMQEGVFVLNQNRQLQFVNPALGRMFGCLDDDASVKKTIDRLLVDDANQSENLWRHTESVLSENPLYDSETELRHSDGHYFPANISAARLSCGERVLGVVWMFRDITDRVRLIEQQHYSAFREGVAEMNATMIHNFGNAMQDIASRARKIEEESDNIVHLSDMLLKIRPIIQNRIHGGTAPEEVYSDLLTSMEETGKEMRRNVVDHFKDNSRQMDRSIGHIFEMIRLQQSASKHETNARRFVLKRLFEDLHAMMADTLTQNRIDLFVTVYPEISYVMLPRNQMLQVMINLVQNSQDAILSQSQSGTRKGTITITARFNDGWLEISIQDDGCGIAQNHLKSIFQRGCERQGSGYDLHAVANFVQSQGGAITAISDGENLGATLVIQLPREVVLDQMPPSGDR